MPTIRLARPDEADAIARLVDDAYGHYVARMGQKPGPMRDDYPARVAERVVWVAVADDALHGILVLLDQPDHLLLDNIAVAPASQGRGIGRLLMAFAEAEAARLGHAEIRLYTHITMIENYALYLKLGFEETHRAEQAGFQRIFMRKRLR